MNQVQEKSSAELRLLYQDSIAELEFFKRQQWSVTHSASLFYAAIAGIAQLLTGNIGSGDKRVLCLVYFKK